MGFDFDQEISRIGTNSVKWEFISQDDDLFYGDHADPKHGDQQLLPMWVADMDFRSPPAVVEALVERAAHGIYGYTRPTDSYFDTVLSWNRRRYNWVAEKEWIQITPGVVPAINMLVRTFTRPGEKVLVQRPVYYPFTGAIENNQAVLVNNPLLFKNGRYEMDFDDLARKTADPHLKLAILCNPHNPVGRLWTVEELTRFGEICLANDVLVIADEIHCDLIYDGHTFVPFAALNEQFARKSITCMAPSKTFNLAGLKISNIFIPDKETREAFAATLLSNGIWGTNVFGVVAAEAAYTQGEAWLEAMMAYVQGNYRFMVDYFDRHLPMIKTIEPEGTYLVWVDFRALEMSPEDRKQMIMEKAKVYLDEGELFGAEGEGFERFNLACPRRVLEEALGRLKQQIEAIYVKNHSGIR